MRWIPNLLTSLLLTLLALTAVAEPAAAQVLPGLGSGSAPEEGAAEGDASAASLDPVELLLGILQDEEARARLVEQLQAAAPTGAPEAEAEPVEERPTLGGRIATMSEGAAEMVLRQVELVVATVARAPALLSEIEALELGVVFEALRTLLLTIVATVAVFLSLRALAIPFYRRIGARAKERPPLGRVMPFLGAGVMDFAIVFVAWAIGYAVALLFFGAGGEIQFTQVLYLNAFLGVELVKAVLRLLLSPSTQALRPLNLSDWAARRLYRVLRMVTSIVGYGMLLILPIVVQEAGYFEGRSTAAAIWTLAIVYVVLVVLRYRRPVGDWLLMQTDAPSEAPLGREGEAAPVEAPPAEVAPTEAAREGKRQRLGRAIAQAWYWFALAWLLWLFLTVLGRRPGAVTDVLVASAKVALALAVGLIVSGALGKLIDRGIKLPQGVTERVPLLETRLNRYVPRILLVLRLGILIAVVVYAFETLTVVSAGSWMASEFGLRVGGIIVSVALISLLAFVVWLALASWVDYRLNPDYGDVPTAREQTLLTLLRNAVTIAILILTMMFVLSEIGLNIGPLLASAGVVGLAIGFGAQKMVQDIITGVFIQFENAINVGDVVSAGGITGSVERLTVRSVSLRDLSGIYHIIPFSSVDTVSNYTRDFSYYVVDMGVAYRENVPEVKQAMHDAFEELRSDPEHGAFILGDLEWFGLDAFGDNAVVLKCRIKTWPGKQWGIGRAYNELVKRVFDERSIEIPFPQRSIWFGEDRQGNAPPLRLAGNDAGPASES